MELKFLNYKNIKLKKNENGYIMMKSKDENEYIQVSFVKCFPISNENEYISVIDEDDNEIYIIKDLKQLPKGFKDLIKYDMEIRYFMPEIINIKNIKEEFGYIYWKVETDKGFREFTTKSSDENIKLYKNSKLLIEDIDSNRYIITDLNRLKGKFKNYLISNIL